MDVFSAIVTFLLIIDSLGNSPPFLSALKTVPQERRRMVLMREIAFAYVVLLPFLFLANYTLRFLRKGNRPEVRLPRLSVVRRLMGVGLGLGFVYHAVGMLWRRVDRVELQALLRRAVDDVVPRAGAKKTL